MVFSGYMTSSGIAGSCAAAAAMSLQSCPTLCDPIDGSPPGSPVPGIVQARTMEWVAITHCQINRSHDDPTFKGTIPVKDLCGRDVHSLIDRSMANSYRFLLRDCVVVKLPHSAHIGK